MSADPAVLEYAEPKRPLAIPSQRTEEDNARLPRRAVDFGWRFHAKPIRLLPDSSLSLFPRRQMSLLQLGEVDKLLVDPAVWLCFNCADCTSGCPAKAGPGRVMAAIRRVAVERYSVPRGWGRWANQPRGFLSMLLAAIALLLATIAMGGSF